MKVRHREVMVVDDDEDVRTMLCIALSVAGYSTACAADGVEALHSLRRGERPALVLVDRMMPKMDGDALIRTMAEDASLAQIPVAIISGQLDSDTPSASPQVIARLVKPLELDELLDVVHRVAGGAAPPDRRV